MTDQATSAVEAQAVEAQATDAPRTAALLLATFAEFYRQETGAEEDVHRSLPFFGTAFGIVIGALAYAAGRLPRWPDVARHEGRAAFWVAGGLLALSVLDAICVLVFLARAIKRRDYRRIGPEADLQARVAGLQDQYDAAGISGDERDRRLAGNVQQILIESYAQVTPLNRGLNRRRYRFRALASSHLIRSLNWALGATTIILVADKLGYFPKVAP